MMIVAFDCDGVLSNFSLGAAKAIESFTDLKKVYELQEKLQCWDWFEVFLDEAQLMRMDAIIKSEGFCRDLEPIGEGLKTLEAVKERLKDALGDDFKIKVVPTPWKGSKHWFHERIAWVEEHTSLSGRDVTFSCGKNEIAADIFIDDKDQNLLNAEHSKKKIIWDRPCNQKADETDLDLFRAKSCEDVMRLLEIAIEDYLSFTS